MKLMQKAKARMLLKHVFYASLLLSTEVKEDKTVPTAATDMVKVIYNPDFIEGLKDPELVLFVLAHEVMHIVLKHGLRMGGRNMRRWNVACDFAINLMLKKAGFTVWQYALCDDKYDGMSAEQIYDQREKGQEKRKGQGKGSGEGEGDQNGLGGDLIEPGNMSPEERAVVEQAIQQKIAQAASMARMAGKMGADLERLVDGILNPPLPWQQLLREYMTKAAHDDESWSKRNRRFAHIYLPTRYSEAMGELVIIVDTSGSVQAKELKQVEGEINEICETVKPERVRVVYVDAQVAGEEQFEPGDPVVLHARGGGGTDMRVGCEYVEKYDPLVVVMITDGYTPWPSAEPSYPLIVCCTTDQPVPIGQVVRMTS